MRILLWPASYAPVLGGLQTVAAALARQLMARGHDVRVLSNRYPRALPAAEVLDGVPVERHLFLRPGWGQLRGGRPDLFLASLYHYPGVRARLTRLMRSFRPDVVNVHFPDSQIPFVLALRHRFGFRLVVSVHGDDVERFAGDGPPSRRPDPRRLALLLRAADAVTACSGQLLERASRLEPAVAARGTVIYNGIDPARFADRTPYRHGRPYVLAYGRLTRKKGFDLLLEAFARLVRDRPELGLILAGEGEEREVLEALARQLGVADSVRFHGRASPEAVVRLLNGCLVLVVPSRVEPFGIVTLEGLAAGRPILATRVGGMGEFLTPFARAGVDQGRPTTRPPVTLVSPTAQDLFEGLRLQLAGDGAGDAARADVLREYSWSKVAERYERVLGGSPAAI
jgi:glycosyltransferase involved in cell wall biosynthesis